MFHIIALGRWQHKIANVGGQVFGNKNIFKSRSFGFSICFKVARPDSTTFIITKTSETSAREGMTRLLVHGKLTIPRGMCELEMRPLRKTSYLSIKRAQASWPNFANNTCYTRLDNVIL